MIPHQPITIPVPLTLKRILILSYELAQVRCLSCDTGLDLHQPDAQSPDRLLGICERCRQWYLLDLLLDEEAAVIVLLPEKGFVRNLET